MICMEIAVRILEFSYATKTHHQGTVGLVCNLTLPHLHYSRIIGWSATSLARPPPFRTKIHHLVARLMPNIACS